MVHLQLLTLLGVFLTAGPASWGMALLEFGNSNCLSEVNSASIKCSSMSGYISFELNFMLTQVWVFFNFVLLNSPFSTELQESYPSIKLHSKLWYSSYKSTEAFFII